MSASHDDHGHTCCHASKNDINQAAGAGLTDPVCGMKVDPATALGG